MSSQQLQWIVEFDIKRGKKTEFEKVLHDMSNLVRLSEPGTRKYEWFIDEKGSNCVVIESYDSSESGKAHATGQAIQKYFPQLLKLAKVSGFKVCGNPSEELMDELRDVNAIVYRFVDGYSR